MFPDAKSMGKYSIQGNKESKVASKIKRKFRLMKKTAGKWSLHQFHSGKTHKSVLSFMSF